MVDMSIPLLAPYGRRVRRPETWTWLAALLGGSGVLHLARPQTYEWLVPPEFGAARPWVLGTGLAEIATAALLARPGTRGRGGRSAAVLLVMFVPAHVHTFRVVPRTPKWMTVSAVRLVLQVPLVRAALRVARAL
jgi:uncharacterized membrane protein